MIDHLTLPVSDIDGTLRQLVPALAPLGYAVVMDVKREDVPALPIPRITGLGAGKPDLWLRADDRVVPMHVAFTAKNREQVDAFYQAALAAGMKDNGAPGPRPHYDAGYYGAFVIDRDGHNLEVVFHG
jgi:catechol 2,3-dioxygenase-like lactoylglutathione lyase family enzyme